MRFGMAPLHYVYGPEKPRIQTEGLGHLLVRSLVRSHLSLIRLLRTTRFARTLCFAHSFTHFAQGLARVFFLFWTAVLYEECICLLVRLSHKSRNSEKCDFWPVLSLKTLFRANLKNRVLFFFFLHEKSTN